ncbi:Cytochrome c oxidase subunit 6b-2 [Carex littledalei]|uniref:Cytochrome c oxidase subunit 6b-2 n=1 Tax=Carex littledalei TaxID=544730 RepID=A0A833RG50_9POAL|nr:Cytochrome c oxidase subunit 6b-2 [Carex littledalei]
MADIELKTAPADFRFPTTNQTRHCFTRYVEFHKCVNAKGEDSDDCMKFAKYYRALCPGEWFVTEKHLEHKDAIFDVNWLKGGMNKGTMALFLALSDFTVWNSLKFLDCVMI